MRICLFSQGADASKEDLFDAHDFDIEIDVGDMGGPTPGGPTLAAMKPMGGGSGGGAGMVTISSFFLSLRFKKNTVGCEIATRRRLDY